MPDHLLPWLLSTHSVLSAAGLLIYALMSHVLRQRRHPSAAVGWVLLLLSAPYVGIPLYLTFGNRKLPRAHRPAAARCPAAMRAGRARRRGHSGRQSLVGSSEDGGSEIGGVVSLGLAEPDGAGVSGSIGGPADPGVGGRPPGPDFCTAIHTQRGFRSRSSLSYAVAATGVGGQPPGSTT